MSYCCTEIQSPKYVKQNGDTLTLTCVKEGTILWKINGTAAVQTSSVGEGSVTTSNLKLTNLTIDNAGDYECHTTTNVTIRSFTLTIISSKIQI